MIKGDKMNNLLFESFKFSYKGLVLFMCLISSVGFRANAQTVPVPSFTHTFQNATCSSNGSITVKIPAPTGSDTYENGWIAELINLSNTSSTPSSQAIPATGGDLNFGSLSAATYRIVVRNAGSASLPPQDRPITSSYVNLALAGTPSTISPSCAGGSDGTLTIGITGGLAPYTYTVRSIHPTTKVPITGGTDITRTNINATSQTFTGMKDGDYVQYSIRDACGTLIPGERLLAKNNAADLKFALMHTNFFRECKTLPDGSTDCNSMKMFVNLDIGTMTGARLASIQTTGNSTIKINGTVYNLTYVGLLTSQAYRFTYDAAAVGGPALKHNDLIEVSFDWGCKTLKKTINVFMPLNEFSSSGTPRINSTTCEVEYSISVFGSSGSPDRSVFYCPASSRVKIERSTSTGFVQVFPTTGEWASFPAVNQNDMFASISLGRTVPDPGNYRITVSDGCQSSTKDLTILPAPNPVSGINIGTTTGVSAGTGGITIRPTVGGLEYKVKITPNGTTPPTSITVPAGTAPLNYTATAKTITFPFEATFTGPIDIIDLPIGSYKVELFPVVGTSCLGTVQKTQIVNLGNGAAYNPTISIVAGCPNGNAINYALNPQNAFTPDGVTLFRRNPNGTSTQIASNNSLSGQFANLSSGDYFLNFSKGGNFFYSVLHKRRGQFTYSTNVKVEPYKPIEVGITTVFCDPLNGNPNSGNISVAVNATSTLLYPLKMTLFKQNDLVNPVSPSVELASPVREHVFKGLAEGDYVVKISDACIEFTRNVALRAVNSPPTSTVSQKTICKGSPTDLSADNATNQLYDITWFVVNPDGSNGAMVGTGIPFPVSPTSTTTYRGEFKLKTIFSCDPNGNNNFNSDVEIIVLEDPKKDLAVSDIELCASPANRSVTISNTELGFKYEILDKDGNSFVPKIEKNGDGGDITLTIPSAFALIPGESLQVRSTRISLGCTVILDDKIDILYNNCLEITKTTTATEYDAVGDELEYTIKVKNKGGIDLMGVSVNDPLTQLVRTVNLNKNGGEESIPTDYTVTQVDLSNPSIENIATASITLGGVRYEKSASATVPNGLFEVDGLNCAANSYVIADDTDVDLEVKVPYTSGNPIPYAAGQPISLGNGTLTAVLQAGTINSTGGDLVYRVTGRSASGVSAKFKVEFGDADCEVTIQITQAAVQSVNFIVNTYEDLDQNCVQDSGEVQVAASTAGLFLKIFDQNDVFVKSFPDFQGQFEVSDLNWSAGLIYYYIIDDNDDDTDINPDLLTGWASGIAPLKRYFQVSAAGVPLFNSALVTNLLDPSWDPIDKSICLFRVSGLIDSIDCNSAVLPNLVKGTAVNDAPFGVEYSGGNGGDFAKLVIQSIGVKGLTATLQKGTLENGDGTLDFTLSGTPDSGGDAIFQLNIGGKTCDVKVQVAAPSVSISKTSTRSDYSVVGEIIPYTIEVKNDGNVALTNVVVTDPLTGLTNTILNLAPGGSEPTPTSYTIKQADIEAGEFKNTASAAFTYEGKNYSANADLTIKAIKKPAVSIVKSSTQVSYKSVGEVLNYTITVSNTGNVNLSNLEVRDPLTGFTRTIGSLAVGASENFTTSYPVTQADVDAGKVRNTASVGFVYDGNPASVSAVKDIDYVRVNAVIQAVLDDFSSNPINIQATTIAGNVLSNDLMDGLPVVASAVQIKVTDMGGLTGIVINANGELVLPSTTPSGTYTIKYSICDAKNLSNCSETSAVITVLSGVDLRIIKVAVGSNWFEGDELVYTLVVDNMGSSAASNVVVVDNLPTSLRYISSEIIGGVGTTAVAGQMLTWTIGSIPAGELVEIKLVVKILEIPADTKVTISNIGTVTSLESDMNSVDNSSLATIEVEPFFIPNVITPNGDGLNDQFEIKGLGKFVKNDIVIWNRWGDHILTAEDYQNDWAADGLKQGTYYYILKALDEGNTQHVFKGWIQVITQ